MEVCNPKGGRTAAPAFPAMLLLMMMIMMLLEAYCCGAAVLAKSNTSFRCTDDRLDECLIEEDLELELGFLMNPYVSRILAPVKKIQSSNPTVPAVQPCGHHNDGAYHDCIPGKNPPDNRKCGCIGQNIYCRCAPGKNPPDNHE